MRRSTLSGFVSLPPVAPAFVALFALAAAVGASGACGGDPFVPGEGDAAVDAGFDSPIADALSDVPEEAGDAADAAITRVQWAKAFGGAQSQVLSGLAILPSGDPVMSGTFAGTMSIGGPTLTSAGKTDIFVAQ